MKRNMKKLLLSAFVAIMASTTAAATVLSIAPADAETQTSRFAMVKGAGIRYSDPFGLRFIAELGTQEYAELTAAKSGVTTELGMFIMPLIITIEFRLLDMFSGNVAKKVVFPFCVFYAISFIDNSVVLSNALACCNLMSCK